MRKAALFLISSLTLFLGNANTGAQWEGAEVWRLTYVDVPNRVVGLYVDDTDELFLLYAEGIRDTATGFVYDYMLLYSTKEKGGDWSEPQEIQTPEYIIGQNRKSVVGFDAKTGKTHILYYGWAFYDTLYYTNSDTPDWEFVKIDSLESGRKYILPEMAFDSLGNVHVAWYESDWSGGSWVQYMYMNNSTGEWVKQAVSLPIWMGIGGSWPVALAVETNGTAHITYGGAGVSECDYVRNDSLNSENWETDTIPRPSIPLCSHRYQELLADPSNTIHLFTRGYSCPGGDTIFQFYYHKQGDDSLWSQPDLVQVHPPDSGLIQAYFIDQQGHVHLALSHFGGFSIIYTNNETGDWLEPELLLYELDAPGAGESFLFGIDSEGQGHAVYRGFDPSQGFWDDDSLEVYYYSPPNSSVDGSEESVLPDFTLFQNYPNPFNCATIIKYNMRSRGHATLKIYNILGKEVVELVDASQGPGHYVVRWDGKNNQRKEVASGIYLYQLTVRQAHRPEQSRGRAGDYKETKKLVLVK